MILSEKKINPFGGINFVINELKRKKISDLIDDKLGLRPKQSTYSFSDIILYWIYSNLCGAERLEDAVQMKSHLEGIPNLANPSPDRISGIFRKLASQKKDVFSHKGIKHEFCIDRKTNGMMLDIAKKLGSDLNGTLDYDNVIIETEKYDTEWTYEKYKGYQPGVAFMGETPVYIEGRNGNSSAQYKMKDTLERCLDLLEEKGIRVKRFRSDSAAYQRDVLGLMDSKGIDFFVRVRSSTALVDDIRYAKNWQAGKTNGFSYEYSEIEYIPFVSTPAIYKDYPTYRLIVKRIYDDSGEPVYYAIVTNNWEMTPLEVIEFYNKRGAIERNFDDLKNNFNWKRLPFSFLNENTFFMIIGAISKIIYTHLRNTFSEKVDFVEGNFRLKNFIFHFITVSSFWTKKGKLRLFTGKDYTRIFE
ncbi:IS1380 family transposase [Flavobacterium sp. PLA-1-15]|uniref:IS1380 family transposase n=1 Tax=Flavobacterium sp. PLA-1-15 TaxID=3380533 RepID=UPI003B7AF815